MRQLQKRKLGMAGLAKVDAEMDDCTDIKEEVLKAEFR